MYILGAFLVYTATKILLQKDAEVDPSKNLALRVARRVLRTTNHYEGQKFLVRRDGRLWATPLLVVLFVVEMSDIMFAVDSIPAIFGVTTDVFIVFTSNIFAILGLRSLFFLIEGLVAKLRFLKVGVALILAFIGVKILIKSFYKMPVAVSLGVLAGVLVISALASILIPAPLDPTVPRRPAGNRPPSPPGAVAAASEAAVGEAGQVGAHPVLIVGIDGGQGEAVVLAALGDDHTPGIDHQGVAVAGALAAVKAPLRRGEQVGTGSRWPAPASRTCQWSLPVSRVKAEGTASRRAPRRPSSR